MIVTGASVDELVMLLRLGASLATARARCAGLPEAEAKQRLREARRRYRQLGKLTREEQRIEAICHMQTLARRAREAGRIQQAICAQRELNRLLGLYGEPGEADVATNELRKEIELARRHLRGAGIGADDTPLSELARLVAMELMRLRSMTEPHGAA